MNFNSAKLQDSAYSNQDMKPSVLRATGLSLCAGRSPSKISSLTSVCSTGSSWLLRRVQRLEPKSNSSKTQPEGRVAVTLGGPRAPDLVSDVLVHTLADFSPRRHLQLDLVVGVPLVLHDALDMSVRRRAPKVVRLRLRCRLRRVARRRLRGASDGRLVGSLPLRRLLGRGVGVLAFDAPFQPRLAGAFAVAFAVVVRPLVHSEGAGGLGTLRTIRLPT